MKALSSIILYTLLCVFTFSCNGQTELKKGNNNHAIKDAGINYNDSVFIERLRNMDFVKEKEMKLNLKNGFDYFVKLIPVENNNYYVIQAGKSNNYRFEVFYNFYCDQKTGLIKLYDALNDSLINIPATLSQ